MLCQRQPRTARTMADSTAKASIEVIAALCEEEEAIAVYSTSTGAAQAQVFRGSASAKTALVSLHDRYLLAPHRTKPAITVWEWGRETPAHTCYVAERPTWCASTHPLPLFPDLDPAPPC